MRKRVFGLITLIISLFVFCDSVDANSVAMYLKCNYASFCTESAWKEFGESFGVGGYNYPDVNVFVPLTDGYGNVKLYGLEINNKKITLYNLENEYTNSDGSVGCWLGDKGGYNGSLTCNENNSLDRSPQTIYTTNTCPACLVSQEGFNFFSLTPIGKSILSIFATDDTWEFVPIAIGDIDNSSSSYMERTEYVVYKYENNRGVERKIAEGYIFDGDIGAGAYAFVGPNIYKWFKDDVKTYQMAMIAKQGADFWKVHENFESRMVSSFDVDISSSSILNSVENVCKLGEEDCINNHGFEILIDSNDSNNNIKNAVVKWYDDQKEALNNLTGVLDVANNDKLNSTSENLNNNLRNGKAYSFSSGYNAEKLVSDLEKAYAALEKAYDSDLSFMDCGTNKATSNAIGSATSCLYTDVLDILEIKDIAIDKTSDRYYLNENFLVEAIMRDVNSAVDNYLKQIGQEDDINLINISTKLNDYVLLYYTTVSYLDASPISFGMDSLLSNRVSELRSKFSDLVHDNELDIYPVVDCKGLLGEKLINKINSYLDIIKIIIPIILICFGIFEFAKAIFAGDDDQMKKSQKSFIKRIGISVLIFITPSLVNFLLQLANKVWPIIEPASCGLFE